MAKYPQQERAGDCALNAANQALNDQTQKLLSGSPRHGKSQLLEEEFLEQPHALLKLNLDDTLEAFFLMHQTE